MTIAEVGSNSQELPDGLPTSGEGPAPGAAAWDLADKTRTESNLWYYPYPVTFHQYCIDLSSAPHGSERLSLKINAIPFHAYCLNFTNNYS